jgi:DNA-directed RNA polymerase specialized sigma24 family protein
MRTENESGRTERRVIAVESLDALSDAQLVWLGRGSEDDAPANVDALVRRAVRDALSPKQREVVEAYFFLGLSQGEIARRLGIRQQVVHKRLYGAEVDGRRVGGAMRKLRIALAPALGRVGR